MDWRIKGAIQKVLGYVPGGQRIHYHLQRRIGGLRKFDVECDVKLDDWRLMMGHLRNASVDLPRATLVEVGTGWYPTFPLALHLAGASRIITYDLNRYMSRDLLIALAERLTVHIERIARESGRDAMEVERCREQFARALGRGASIEDASEGAIGYYAPGDAADTKLLADSIDVVFSNSVLEHIPGEIIAKIMSESMRILRPGAIVFHSVNCGDHYAYVDRSIHQLHYLQYSEAEWQRWNNAFLYQNRLRACDFVKLATDAGFVIEVDTSRPHPDRLRQLDSIRVEPSFLARYTRDQLAITSIDFVGRKP